MYNVSMSWNNDELGLANTLDDVLKASIKMLKRLRADGYTTHHIAGPITADGDENINVNLVKLMEWRSELSAALGPKAFVFTSPVIFSEGLYVRLGTFDKEPLQRESEFRDFWDKLLESGVVDEIHFTPGWERSVGATREHETAERLVMKINYLEAKTSD